eukprot:TRINITY_DN17306_c0_g1_i1.p1 TRINITY_DN17306_c0_g1~~TRINITY_DN17306_c0_g1_i1.p1  ORF type:complete len:477 (+),score=84.03 TRINITY_DN17306_c0_g1_i1:103-1533(+)
MSGIAGAARGVAPKLPEPGRTLAFVKGVANGVKAGKPYAFLRKWHDDHGPLVRVNTVMMNSVSIVDPKIVKWVTRNDPERFTKGTGYDAIKRGWLDESLVLNEDDAWRRKRSVYARAFKLGAIRSYVPAFVDIAESTKAQWQQKHDDGEIVDAVKSFESVALEVIGRAGFGVTGMGAPGNKFASSFVSYLDVLQDEMTSPLMMILPKKVREGITKFRGQASLSAMNAESQSIISDDKSAASSATPSGASETRLNLVSLMKSAAKEEGIHIDADQMAREANLFLFAGHDTTSATMAWAFSLLAEHPEVQQRAFEEIAAVPADQMTQEFLDPRSLPFFSAVLKETLRLRPPAPMVLRRTKFDEKFGDYEIPAQTDLMLNIWCMLRDGQVFKDPDAFMPQRWLDAEPEALKAMQDHWVPFMVGARSCIGQQFSMMEMRVVLATLLRSFSLEPASQPEVKQRMLLLPKNIKLKCTPRQVA